MSRMVEARISGEECGLDESRARLDGRAMGNLRCEMEESV